jgi:hypothetical protein
MLRKPILELQARSQRINKPPMRRIYSPIDSKNVALVEKTGRRDPIFHEITPRSRRDLYTQGSRPPTVGVNFVPIWLHSARRRGIRLLLQRCHNWYLTDLSDGNRFKLSWKIPELMWLFFGDELRKRPPNSCRHAITQVLSPITSTARGFSIRAACPQEAGVICCAGLSIVAGVARRQGGRSGHHRPMWTDRRYASEARGGAFRMLATLAF